VAELKQAYGDKMQTSLVQGDNGIFDVKLDGKLIYSKQTTGRFPGYREIPNLIDEKLIRS